MQPISQDFAPPFKLIAPYFILGTFIYVLASIFIFTVDATNLHHLDGAVLSWVHLFLLGFIMMIIFGAMAQLIPVTLEVGHFSVEFYYLIWPLLLIGTLLMVFGFSFSPSLLPYGGVLVLVSMSIFLLEVFLTIRKVQKFTNVINSLIVSNIALLIGIIIGVILALTYAGVLVTDILSLLKAHVFLVVAGYICITIMALSLVLLPMFGLSHNFSQKPLNTAVIMMSVAVSLVLIASLIGITFLEYVGYILSILSLLIYFYQIVLIYQTRVRKENDIYVVSLFVAFTSLILSILLCITFMITGKESLLLATGWLLFMGFFGITITGHLYKIVPFLVWFEKFAPLVGKEPVPMLADMVPVKAAQVQLCFISLGIAIITFAIILANNTILYSGASFLSIGAIFLFRNLIYMIRFK